MAEDDEGIKEQTDLEPKQGPDTEEAGTDDVPSPEEAVGSDEVQGGAPGQEQIESHGAQAPDEPGALDRARSLAGNAADGARKAAGALGQQTVSGFSALKAVSQAKRAHAEAADALAKLKASIDEDSATLSHRQEVEASYDAIVSAQNDRMAAARAAQGELSGRLEAARGEEARLQDELDELKEANERAQRPLRKLAESAKSSADDASRTLSEAKRSVRSAENAVRDLTRRRDGRIATANKAADNARQRLAKLQAELSELKRDPESDAKKESDVQAEVTAEMARLSRATDEAKAAPGEAEPAIEAAEQQLAQAQVDLRKASKAADEAKKESKRRSGDLEKEEDRARKAENVAEDRVVEAQKQVRSLEHDLEAQKQEEADASAVLAEANDIHAHPEETSALAHRITDNGNAAARQELHVQSLADQERQLRESTRHSRIAFILVACAVVILAVVLFLVFTS